MEKNIKTTNQVVKYSQSKLFYKQDLILYGIAILAIVFLFVFLVIIPKTSKPIGFSASINNEIVFTFDFSNESLDVKKDTNNIIHDKENNTITIYGEDLTSYNVLSYDSESFTVRITDTNCSNHDCVDFFEINSNNGVIYCLPHDLKILPLSPSASEPSTGGRL